MRDSLRPNKKVSHRRVTCHAKYQPSVNIVTLNTRVSCHFALFQFQQMFLRGSPNLNWVSLFHFSRRERETEESITTSLDEFLRHIELN